MNCREICASTNTPLSLWRRSNDSVVTEHNTNRRHLASQRFEERRARADNPPINELDLPKSCESISLLREDDGINENILSIDARNIDIRKKLNEAALSEAMSGPGRSHRKQQSNTLVQRIPTTSLPRYGRRLLRLKQLRESETVDLTLQQPHTQILQSKKSTEGASVSAPRETSNPPVDISLDAKSPPSLVPLAESSNLESSENTVHTVPTSDDELSCEEISSRASIEVIKQKEQQQTVVVGSMDLNHHFEAIADDEANSKLKWECVQKEHANEIESLRTTIAALQLNQKHCEDELEAATMENKRAQAYIEKAAETKKAQDEEISKLKEIVTSAQNDSNSKDKTMVDLQMKIQSNDAYKEEMMSKIKSQEVQIQELTSSHSKLQIHYNKCVSEAKGKDDELSRMKDQMVQETGKKTALVANVNHLERELGECKEENKELNNQLTAERISRHEIQEKIRDKDKIINELSIDLNSALSDSRNLKSKVDAMMITSEVSSAEIMSLKNWKISTEKLLDEKENEIEGMKSNLEAQLEECSALIADKNVEMARMQKEAYDMNKKDEEIKRLNVLLSQLKVAHESKVKDLSTLCKAHSTAEKSLVEKDAIISELRSNKSCLEAELEECKDFYVKKIAFTQTPISSQQMERNLRTKEVELELLKVELERGKVECSKLRSVVAHMTTDSEITELKVWKKNAQERMRKQQEEHKKFVEDKIDCISTLQQRLQASEYEATKRYQVELLKICRERDELKSEVESKKVEINEITAEKNELMHEMNSLRVWKDEAISNLAMKEREVSVLEVAARRNLDAENELTRQRAKCREAKEKLHDMERALRAVALERKRM